MRDALAATSSAATAVQTVVASVAAIARCRALGGGRDAALIASLTAPASMRGRRGWGYTSGYRSARRRTNGVKENPEVDPWVPCAAVPNPARPVVGRRGVSSPRLIGARMGHEARKQAFRRR